MREQREILERHADAALLGGASAMSRPLDDDRPGVRLLDAGDEAQQQRLAGAGGPKTTMISPALDTQRDIVQHRLPAEGFGERVELEKRHGLSLHRAERQALDQIALGVERQQPASA